MAVRKGDTLSTGHICASTTTLDTPSQSKTFANSILCAIQGTPTVSHPFPPAPPCVPHVANLNEGSPNVNIGGIPWGRVDDSADAGKMTIGSTNVFVNGK
tara:strand:+ start:704 stop:1003 length:300 start_codon:yes stop_codon:yes gene_type:complete